MCFLFVCVLRLCAYSVRERRARRWVRRAVLARICVCVDFDFDFATAGCCIWMFFVRPKATYMRTAHMQAFVSSVSVDECLLVLNLNYTIFFTCICCTPSPCVGACAREKRLLFFCCCFYVWFVCRDKWERGKMCVVYVRLGRGRRSG